ncbi:MAG: O-antigen ligase family protein, partial [bacterium]|nr:O-antigen ligase family protein [bacterium]
LRAAIYVLVTVAVIACTYGLVQYFGFAPLWSQQVRYFEGRIVSTFGNPAFLSSFLVMIIPIVAALWLNTQTKTSKVILSVLFLLMFTTLLAASARSALAGLVAAFILFILYLYKLGYRREIKVFSISLLVLAVLAGSVVYFAGQKDLLRSRLEAVVNPQALGTSLQQRFLIWCCSLEMFYQHPLTGQGWGLFELFYPYYQASYLKDPAYALYQTHANHAHNELLQIAAELGTAGILLSLYFISVLTRQVKRLLTSKITRAQQLLALGIFSGIMGMIVDSMFNVSFHIPAPALVFWCLVGLLTGLQPLPDPARPVASGFWRAGAVVLIPFMLLCIGISVLHLQAARHHFKGMNYAAASEKTPPAEQQQKYSLLLSGEQELLQSLQLYPWNKEVAYDLGGIYFRLGEKDQAIVAYTRAIELDFSYAEMFYLLGIALLEDGRLAAAEQALRQALTLNPNSVPVKAALANLTN